MVPYSFIVDDTLHPAMAASLEIIDYLDRLLDIDTFDDFGPNGLQVPGRSNVHTVASGVTASAELFARARDAEADLVLVHHGLFWQGPPRPLDRAAKARLQILFEADMGLAAYHLPLDGHLEHGNNALLARALGAEAPEPFAAHGRATIGVRARFPGAGIAPQELADRVRETTAREPLVFLAGPDPVRTIGIVSGSGSDYLEDAVAAGLDAFLTGEPTERVMARTQEAGVHYLAGGHYATETFGVRRLGELVAERFDVRHLFVDVPNPI
jgi:dinuclear metal center YbgI/SA1388 family protein